jgi:hypothetical protein
MSVEKLKELKKQLTEL